MAKKKIIKQKIILFAEDDQILSDVFLLALESEKEYKIILAANGQEAIEKIKKNKPDIILLDLMMPKKNGFEVLEIVRQKFKMKDVPIIILSNLSQETDIALCHQIGATDYIVKSNFSMHDIIKKIKKYIK